jgi:hypothetical protein
MFSYLLTAAGICSLAEEHETWISRRNNSERYASLEASNCWQQLGRRRRRRSEKLKGNGLSSYHILGSAAA